MSRSDASCSADSIIGMITPAAPASRAERASRLVPSASRTSGSVPPNSRARKMSGRSPTEIDPCSISTATQS